MLFTVCFAGVTDPGLERAENEDNWAAHPEMGLYVVADGMGGRQAGALASRVVVETLPAVLRRSASSLVDLPTPVAKKALGSALATLSSQLYLMTRDRPELAGMGSTVVAAFIVKGVALIAHLGDSRAYLLHNGRFRRLTRDHTLAQLLLDTGDISAEEAVKHPARHQLTRFVGMAGDPLPQVRTVRLKSSDRLLLCSDGLTKEVDDRRIQTILEGSPEPQTCCRDLIAAAREAGARDNVTVILLTFIEDGIEDGK